MRKISADPVKPLKSLYFYLFFLKTLDVALLLLHSRFQVIACKGYKGKSKEMQRNINKAPPLEHNAIAVVHSAIKNCCNCRKYEYFFCFDQEGGKEDGEKVNKGQIGINTETYVYHC